MLKDKKILQFLAIAGIVLILGGAVFAYLFLREPEAPSVDLVTPSQTAPTQVQEAEDQPTAVSASEEMPSEEMANVNVFRIDAAQSEARFTLNELLDGKPTVVVGITSQVSGEFSVDLLQMQDLEIGEILVNARDLTTDKSFRNRAIHNRILDSNTYEFISFFPGQVTPLPEEVSFGESLVFEISGDLTIKGVTQQVIFTANVTPISETQINGHAETMLVYADYGIIIPSVQSVAEVDEEVLLEIDFIAIASRK